MIFRSRTAVGSGKWRMAETITRNFSVSRTYVRSYGNLLPDLKLRLPFTATKKKMPRPMTGMAKQTRFPNRRFWHRTFPTLPRTKATKVSHHPKKCLRRG